MENFRGEADDTQRQGRTNENRSDNKGIDPSEIKSHETCSSDPSTAQAAVKFPTEAAVSVRLNYSHKGG